MSEDDDEIIDFESLAAEENAHSAALEISREQEVGKHLPKHEA